MTNLKNCALCKMGGGYSKRGGYIFDPSQSPYMAMELSKVRRFRNDPATPAAAVRDYIMASRRYNEMRLGVEAADALYRLEMDDCYYYFMEHLPL